MVILAAMTVSSCKKEQPAPAAIANFFVGNNACVSPCWVYFYDQSANAVQWEWDFGNNFNSTTQNDSMLYNTTGFYDVELMVWNSDGVADSITKTIMVY